MNKLSPKTDGASLDIVEQNIAKLKKIFPDAFTEGKIEFDALREILGDYIDDREERYSFTWNGKSRARQLAQTPSTGTLRPCPEESVNWDTTQDLFFEGDNLEVLKLLQKSYHKKIKMIYIDPPYNTGNDFVYQDDFRDNMANYLRLTSQTDGEGHRLSANAETSGRYHTNWLNMMYPRLMLARNLLTDDGVIFVSIDENETANLRKMCDEVFGEENFLCSIVWEKRFTRSNNAKMFSTLTENVLCFRKSPMLETLREPRDEKANSIYSNPDNDPRGPWTSVSYVNPATKEQRPNLVYQIVNPVTGEYVNHPTNAWKYEKPVHMQHVKENRLYWGVNGTNTYPRLKRFLSEMDGGMVPVDLWRHQKTGTTDEGSKELEALMGEKIFDFPKPRRLVQRAVRLASNGENDIILDFFAGTCSSAHAVMHQNLSDGGTRRFIMVQLPEPCDEKSKAYKAGFKTIADIGKERIRRVIKNIQAEQAEKAKESKGKLPGMADTISNLDLGFKVFKLDSSNIKPWDAGFDNLEESLLDAIENIKSDRTEADVLYELLLKYGLDLAIPIEERKIADKTIYIVGAGALVVCLADQIGLDVIEGIAAIKEEFTPEVMRIVFRDASFEDDVVKINAVQILQQAGIDDIKSL